MRVIEAPCYYEPFDKDVSVFLAGGITNCRDWQWEAIKKIEDNHSYDSLVILNPRRDNFPMNNKLAGYQQILWEFEMIEKCDIFSMYFVSSDSDQPICMYELGRNISEIKNEYMGTWGHRIIVSVEKGYKREQDVLIQTRLATNNIIKPFSYATPASHAMAIVNNYNWLMRQI